MISECIFVFLGRGLGKLSISTRVQTPQFSATVDSELTDTNYVQQHISSPGFDTVWVSRPLGDVNQWPSLMAGSEGNTPDDLINADDGEALYRYPCKLLALKSGDKELYRLDDDPTESVDLSAAQPDKVAELC